MKKTLSALVYLPALLLPAIASCSDKPARWYSQEQVKQGAVVFSHNCAACHGDQAQGITANWRQKMPDGSYPPPPLNGSAHAWHHPLAALKRTIHFGGIPLGGKMPPFRDKLSEAEIEAVIAYFQNMWNDEIYAAWLQRGGLK